MFLILSKVHAFVWGVPALAAILGVGMFLSVRLHLVQLRLFPVAVRAFFRSFRREKDSEGVSRIQALWTALAATLGTGNLVGVAGAICLGGPGAVFWMWICALLGMAVKYTEVILAVRFRVPDGDGFSGGPMYVIARGMGTNYICLARLYCVFGLMASFGVGNGAQIGAAVSGMDRVTAVLGVSVGRGVHRMAGIVLGVLIAWVLHRGTGGIVRTAQVLVPFASAGYLVLCAGVLLSVPQRIPGAFGLIVRGAFSPRAVTGGMLGSACQALRVGCSRGVFTNEAGMGTAAMAHASARVDHPVQQGVMGILEVFLDTMVLCTLTALVILVSGAPIPYGTDAGAELTIRAFEAVYDRWAGMLLGLILVLLATATVFGWGLYGLRCAEFLFGKRSGGVFALTQGIAAAIFAVIPAAGLWLFSEIANGLMVIPNLICLAALAPEAVRITKEYREKEFIENGLS